MATAEAVREESPSASQREMSNTLVGSPVHDVAGDHSACIKRPAQFNAALMSACVGLAA